MEISSNCIHVNPNAPNDAFPNVVQFKFNHLRKYKSFKQVKAQPIKCSNCDTILLESTTCSFCNNRNRVEQSQTRQIPENSDVEFMLDQARRYGNENAKYIVFCLDLSGSMGEPVQIDEKIQLPTDEVRELKERRQIEELRKIFGNDFDLEESKTRFSRAIPSGKRNVSRMEMIQTGVIKNLENIQEISGDKRVAIVTFNGSVSIVGDGTFDKLSLSKIEALNSEREIESFVRQIPTINHIGHNKDLLINKVLDFENDGPTALGPALYASILIASKKSGSTVLLFTDGKPNLGLGALDGNEAEKKEAEKFYNKMAELAHTKGVTVSISTLKGEDSNLNILSQVANNSDGRALVLDPTKLDEIIYEFTETTSVLTTVATNMELTIIAPEEFYFKDYTEASTNSNKLKKKIGNVKKNTEVGFEIVGKRDSKKYVGKKIPIQLQLSYKSDEGFEVIRAILTYVDVTDDARKVERNADRCIMGSYVLRTKASVKNSVNDMVSLARKVSTIATDKDDKFDKGKFETEINKIGIKLDDDENDSVVVKSTKPQKALMEDNPIDDYSVSLRNKASQATSDSLRKKDKK